MSTSAKQAARKANLDADVVKAIGHPLRMQLLERLNERVASPVELARELGESVQLVSYHVRLLRDLGFVELVRTTPRRGAVEHHYRAIRRPYFSDEDYEALPPNARDAIAGSIIGGIVAHVVHAHESGVFERTTDINITNDDIVLDEEAWKQLTAKVAEVYEVATELQAQSLVRIRDGAEGLTARLSVMLYPVPEDAPSQAIPSQPKKPKKKPKGS